MRARIVNFIACIIQQVFFDWDIASRLENSKHNTDSQKGNKHKKENYHQISLTSIVCKIVMKIIRSRITTFWFTHHVLNPNQFGYLEGKSTLAQLLSCYHDWCSSRNNLKTTDATFLNLSKAFNSLPYERLLLKLSCYGIDGPLLRWF